MLSAPKKPQSNCQKMKKWQYGLHQVSDLQTNFTYTLIQAHPHSPPPLISGAGSSALSELSAPRVLLNPSLHLHLPSPHTGDWPDQPLGVHFFCSSVNWRSVKWKAITFWPCICFFLFLSSFSLPAFQLDQLPQEKFSWSLSLSSWDFRGTKKKKKTKTKFMIVLWS